MRNNALRTHFEALLDLLAPLRCPLCELKLTGGGCPDCGFPDRRLVSRRLHRDSRGEFLVLAGGRFEGPLRKLVHAFKYRQDPGAIRLLVRQTLHALPSGLHWQILVPVPAHRVRARERGGQSVRTFARALSRATGVPLRTPLTRVRYTEPLTGLGGESRRRLLEGALRSRAVEGCLLLVDDVSTTWATFHACRRVLLEAGARSVDLLVAARTPRTPSPILRARSAPRRRLVMTGLPLWAPRGCASVRPTGVLAAGGRRREGQDVSRDSRQH